MTRARIRITPESVQATFATEADDVHVMAVLVWSRLERTMTRLFDRWLGARRLKGIDDFRAVGLLLYDLVLGNDVGIELGQHLKAATEDRPLRIELDLRAANELTTLPWEFMVASESPPTYLGTDPTVRLTRSLPSLPTTATPRSPTTALLAVSRPAGVPSVGADEVKAGVEKLASRDDVEVVVVGGDERPLTFDGLVEAVSGLQPALLHILAHGRFDADARRAELAFASLKGSKIDWVDDHTLVQELCESRPRLVILQACESGKVEDATSAFAGFVPRLVEAGVPAVVAMQYPVRVGPAKVFSKTFYQHLGMGYCIADAVQLGRRAMASGGHETREFGTPVAYLSGRPRLFSESPAEVNVA